MKYYETFSEEKTGKLQIVMEYCEVRKSFPASLKSRPYLEDSRSRASHQYARYAERIVHRVFKDKCKDMLRW